MLKTFDEWKREGFVVIKGEASCHKGNGKCYFNENQVTRIKYKPFTHIKYNPWDSEGYIDENGDYIDSLYPIDGSNDYIGDFGDW